MNSYVTTMKKYACRRYSSLPLGKQRLLEQQFQYWKNARDKHNVDNYYSDPDFGLIYAKCLFKARFDCFYALLEDVSQISGIEEVLRYSTEIMSICCGPGPDMAAYICFVREQLRLPYQQLSITCVDKLGYWGDYVKAISHVDYNSSIEFMSSMVTSQFVSNLRNNKYDVCIMSYPQAMCFDRDIWGWFRRKFRFVLVLDQGKYELHNIIKSYNFKLDQFECVGTKRYFYWIDLSLRIFRCIRNHKINEKLGQCNQEIHYRLACGHTVSVLCHSYDENIATKKCVENVKVVRNCGHSLVVKCRERSFLPLCSEKVKHTFQCGHTIFLICNSYDDDIYTMKCEETVTIKKYCGHELNVKCNLKYKEIDKICDRNIAIRHKHCRKVFYMKCFEQNLSSACLEKVNYTFSCGHSTMLTCHSYDNEVRTLTCKELVTVTKDCGHDVEVACSLKKNELLKDCQESIIVRHKHCQKSVLVRCYKQYMLPKCNELVPFTFQCGHQTNFECHSYDEDLRKKTCAKIVLFTKECGHELSIVCSFREGESKRDCTKIVDVYHNSCGHLVSIECYRQFNLPLCDKKIPYKFDCEHEVTFPCHSYHDDIKISKCKVMMSLSHPLCGHMYSVECHSSQNPAPKCDKLITKMCPQNEHQYEAECGEGQIRCTKYRKVLASCGVHHSVIVCHESVGLVIKCLCQAGLVRQTCGHPIRYEERTVPLLDAKRYELEEECGHICGGILFSCGHVCQQKCGSCYYGKLHGICVEKCGVGKLACGHECSLKCHNGAHRLHKCAENCWWSKLKSSKQSGPRRIDWSSTKRWATLLNRYYLSFDSELKTHVSNLVTYMSQRRKLEVIDDIKDKFYIELLKLLNMYSGLYSEVGESHFLVKSFKKIIMLINLEYPFKLIHEFAQIEAQRKCLQSIYAKLGTSTDHLEPALLKLSTQKYLETELDDYILLDEI